MSLLYAGVSKREITPSPDLLAAGRVYLWGFGIRTGPASSVRDPLWARSLAVSDSTGSQIVLVSLDLCALDAAFTARVRARLAASRGLPPERIMLNVTHTHSGPVTMAVATWNDGFDRPDTEYLGWLEDQVVGSIEEAIDARRPARLDFARGETNIGRNRHLSLSGVSSATAPGAVPSGPYDRTLDVLRVMGADQSMLGVAFFHGCHPVFLRGDAVSSDYPGIAREVIETATGGMALFFQGYAGTIDPEGAEMVATGERLGRDVVSLLSGPLQPLDGPIKAILRSLDIPFRELDHSALGRARCGSDPNLQRWAAHIAGLAGTAASSLPVQLQAVRIGPPEHAWHLVASSHEVVAEFAAPIRAIWPDRTSIVAYANSECSYLPTRQVMADPPCSFPFCSNYEGGVSFMWYGHRAPLVEEVDELLLQAHADLRQSMRPSSSAGAGEVTPP